MKIIGPLQSEKASGTIKDVLTFSSRKTGQQARFQRKQKDTNSATQQAQRKKFLNASIACRNMEYGIITIGAAIFGNRKDKDIEEVEGKALTEYNNCIGEILNNKLM
jgi:CRISPR/Cas system-associated endonuclease Cas1